MPADLIIEGSKIITLAGSSRPADAIGVRDGRIAAVGPSGEVRQLLGPATRLIDGSGKTVIPGMFDAHPHMDRQGLKARGGIPLDGCKSIADILDVIREAVARTPEGEWVVLMPMGTPPTDYVYKPEQLTEGRFPTRHDLDKVSPKHPVYIRAPWGWWSHRPFPSVANTRAIELAGVTKNTELPYNTRALVDQKGELSGVFLDRNYAPVIEYTLFRCVPRLTYEDRVAGVRLGSAAYSAVGTTSAYEGHGLTPAIIDAYKTVHAAGELSVRMQIPLSVPTAAFDNRKVADILYHWADALRDRGSGDQMLRFEGVCFDVGDATVANIISRDYPYEQWAGHFYQSLPHDRFVELGVLAAQLGLRMNCLVCYDLERVLRAYEAIDRQIRIRDRRWVIIHVTQASPDQIRRIKELGLVATITPGFMYMASDRFGLDKLGQQGTPIREFIDAGIPTALSTDNVPYSMFFAMWQALSRWDNDSGSKLGESRLSREEALRLSTVTGHQLTWSEGDRGTLEVGKVADFLVVGDDPLTCDEIAVKDIPVERTFVSGREVFTAPNV
ncbi:amidohydrolase family protein [Bradyrhizobium sp. NP1]|uniref:amidohydrolase n=1 Tax=Bradyrhizobium sp. NP1 TaxID=3049772 RepID=UPI0025A5F83D|nr:amidohydrolase family protein [Bradyrhizobium sp. NP1]WJR75073.1 amidohydrolase family protein [Bradyrhizobium sp. NP1]